MHLRELTNLNRFFLPTSHITDAGLPYLAGVSHLETLIQAGTRGYFFRKYVDPPQHRTFYRLHICKPTARRIWEHYPKRKEMVDYYLDFFEVIPIVGESSEPIGSGLLKCCRA